MSARQEYRNLLAALDLPLGGKAEPRPHSREDAGAQPVAQREPAETDF